MISFHNDVEFKSYIFLRLKHYTKASDALFVEDHGCYISARLKTLIWERMEQIQLQMRVDKFMKGRNNFPDETEVRISHENDLKCRDCLCVVYRKLLRACLLRFEFFPFG
jgi:hypothetical protein